MSVEEENLGNSDAYAGLLDNFGSEIGSTLEDLVSDWNEDTFDFEQDAENMPTKRTPRPLFKYRGSMDGDDISDWSLKKARPLAFANPVYDLMMLGAVIQKPRQMTLIPLNQFDINKPHEGDKGKGDKGKHQKKGTLIHKISSFSLRKHSLKKSEPEINVTAPLWTDAPGVLQEPPRRSGSLPTTVETVETVPETAKSTEHRGSVDRSHKPPPLDLDLEKEQVMNKTPPQKTPRTARGTFSPMALTPDDPNPKGIPETQTPFLDLPSDEKTLRPALSTSSIASDVSEDPLEEERTTKTMMEVMNEIEDDSASKQEMTEQNDQESGGETPEAKKEPPGEDAPLLKRNKTLKWSGSRAGQTLIREFTRKSKKAAQSGQAKQLEAIATDSPEVSGGESPAKSDSGEIAKPISGTDIAGDSVKKTHVDRLQVESGKSSSAPTTPKKRDSSAFTILSSLLPPAPKLRRSESSKIRMYIHRMGTNPQNALGYATTEFVKQTLHSEEHRPVVLLHSIRSFLTDMKKYLITSPHVGFIGKIQKILKNMPIQDVEGAIDDALERLVLYPLRDLIYKRLVLDYARSGKIKLVEEAIKLGQTKSPQQLGIRATLIPPNEEAMEIVKHYFMELQATYSPYYKLKHLLSAVTTIYENTSDLTCEDQSARKIGADDFFPLLVHAIVKCDFTAADIEAQYIDGLLDPTLLLGEGGYYLTSLISAVQLLSSMRRRETPVPNITDLQGFLKVGISSKAEKMMESDGALTHKTLHVPPSMTAHNLGMMIAKKYGRKNSAKNFCLHVVVNGVAYPLKPQEFPQLVKMDLLTQFSPDSFFFIYRQLEKVPQKPTERPTVIDSEHLKVNTEEGESVLTAEMEIKNCEVSEANSSNSDSDAKSTTLKKVESLDELAPNDDFGCQDIESPGFADIPLPSDVLLQAAAASDSTNTLADSDPSDTGSNQAHIIQEAPGHPKPADAAQEVPLPLPDVAIAADVIPPTTLEELPNTETAEGTHQHSEDLPPPEQLPSPLPPPALEDLTNPETLKDLHSEVLPPPPITSSPVPTSLPPPHDVDSSLEVTEAPSPSQPIEVSLPPPLEDDHQSSCPEDLPPSGILDLSEVESEEVLPPPPITSSPVHSSLPPPDDVDSSLEITLTEVDPSQPIEVTFSPPVDDDYQSPGPEDRPPSGSLDLTDGESEDDTLTDETYLRATVVDDVLSPVRKRVAAPSKKVQAIIEEEEETQDVPIQIEVSPSHSAEGDLNISQSPNRQDVRPESSMSDVSIGSAGCHSDGYHGAGSDGRHSSRGYHSDSHQADDDSTGGQSSVAQLKTYFEKEITKVSQHAPRATSPHSPK